MKGKLSLALVVCLFLVLTMQAQTGITVNEEKSSVFINEKTADVSLVLKNDAENFNTPITLEILDGQNNPIVRSSQPHLIKKGEHIYKMSLPLGDLATAAGDNLTWYRLRYRVGDLSGVISLSELIRDIFELRVEGDEIQVRIPPRE